MIIGWAARGQAVDSLSVIDEIDALIAHLDSINGTAHADGEPAHDSLIVVQPLWRGVFLPAVYRTYDYYGDFKPFEADYGTEPSMRWLDRANAAARNQGMLLQRFMIGNPDLVRYNVATLPEPPKAYFAKVDPKKHTIEIKEVAPVIPDKLDNSVEKRHWLRTFQTALQFSQAYVSPNWYQGGNNNLNMQASVFYNVKLNQKYHPTLLFESTIQYKLGLNNAPDDSLRNYAISEDLLQLNATFGVKAVHHWYYSVTAQFKTQLLNQYVKNEHRMSSAFLSPAELNAGLGMTYNIARGTKKKLTFDASISPVSYNMKICTKPDSVIAHSDFDIAANKHYSVKFGSTAECKLVWQVTYNIQFRSRLFAFTDYSNLQADWENTLSMEINRYLSTQLYVHARYDSTTPRCADPNWKKLQVKEILSFGVAYKFSSI